MNVYMRYELEKIAATMQGLQKAFRVRVKPFAQKGTTDSMTRGVGETTGGQITLSGKGMGTKSTPKLHKANNILSGLHEGRERATRQIHKGFSGHNNPVIPAEDYLQINTLKGFTDAEKQILRKGTGEYGAQRHAEFDILGEKLPQFKATFDALKAGKTHHPDGRRLLNRHERKAINRAYKKLQEDRVRPDVKRIEKAKERFSKVEGRLDNLGKQIDSRYSGRTRRRKSRRLLNLWDKMEGTQLRRLRSFEGKQPTDFLDEVIERSRR